MYDTIRLIFLLNIEVFMKNSLIGLIAVIVLFFSVYKYQELSHRKTRLFEIPVVSVAEYPISKIIKVDQTGLHSISLNFKGNIYDDDGDVLYSADFYGSKMPKKLEGLLDLRWTLYHDNKVMIEKRSKDIYPGNYSGNAECCYKNLGDFQGVKGDKYLLEVAILGSHPNINMLNPTITIGTHVTVTEGNMLGSFLFLILGLASGWIAVSRAFK